MSSISAVQARGITNANGYIYTDATSAGLQIYEATVPTPTLVGTYNTNTLDGQRAEESLIIDNLMYLAAGPAGYKLIDLRNTPNLEVVASAELPNGHDARAIAVGDGMMYLADDTGKVFQYDVSAISTTNPASGPVTLKGEMDNEWIVHFLAVSEANDFLLAYSSPGGMFIYDVSDTSDTEPDFISHTDVPALADGLNPSVIIVQGSKLFAGFGQTLTYGTALAKFNLADPVNPYIMEWQSMDGQVAGITRGGVLRGDKLFFANSKYDAVSIDLVDVP